MKKTAPVLLAVFWFLCLRLSANEEVPWTRDLNINLMVNQGNTENLSNTLGFSLRRKTDVFEFSGAARYSYGQATFRDEGRTRDKRTTQDKSELESQYNRFLTRQSYALLGFSALKDRIADIDHRLLLGPGVGLHLLRDETHTLSVEAGLSYLMEEVGGQTDDTLLLRLAQRYEWTMNEQSSLWQSLEYLPGVNDTGSYLLNAELGAQARLNGNLSLRIVLKNRYDDTPGRQAKRNDLNLLAGISYRF